MFPHSRRVLRLVPPLCLALNLAGCVAADPSPEPAKTPSPVVAAPPAPASNPAPSVAERPVATINGEPITFEELARPLLETDGLRTLLYLAQLNVTRQAAAKQGITITRQDVKDEYARTMMDFLPSADPKDYDSLLDDVLARMTPRGDRPVTRPLFYISMEANAYLRKMIQPDLAKVQFSDDRLKELFAIRYGQQVQIRCIEVPNREEAQKVKARLVAGEPFAKIAGDVNMNPTLRAMEGEIEPFTVNSPTIPEPLKKAAFLLKDGDVSDIIQGRSTYFLLKMEKHITPKVVKFEDVRDALKREMDEGIAQKMMTALRIQLSKQALQGNALVINDPELRDQFEKLRKQQAEIHDKEAIRNQILHQEDSATTQSGNSANPSTQPALPPAPSTRP